MIVFILNKHYFIFYGGNMLKIIYELFLCFKDIKAFEKTKTLQKGKGLNNDLLNYFNKSY